MTVDEIKKIARDKYGKELNDEHAMKYAGKQGKLSDNELDIVSGGYTACDSEFHNGKHCDSCGVQCVLNSNDDLLSSTFVCPQCGTVYS